jgi:hypothetical protein
MVAAEKNQYRIEIDLGDTRNQAISNLNAILAKYSEDEFVEIVSLVIIGNGNEFDIMGIDKLSNLRELKIFNCKQIKNLKSLESNIELTRLELSSFIGNPVSFKRFPHLIHLTVADVTTLGFCDSLPSSLLSLTISYDPRKVSHSEAAAMERKLQRQKEFSWLQLIPNNIEMPD